MFNYEYEELIANCYPDSTAIFKMDQDTKCVLDLAKQKALRYLETSCSATFGFPGEIRHSRDMQKLVVGRVPSIYESSLCLDLIKDEDIHPSVIQSLQSTIIRARRSSGFRNFFIPMADKMADWFPDDIDDTVLSASALFHLGKFSLDDCTLLADRMLNAIKMGANDGIGTWIDIEKCGDGRNIKMKSRLLDIPREDIGSIINALWFLTEIGMESDARALPSVSCVNMFLDEHLLDVNVVLKHFMIYYTDRFVIYFLLARYVEKSDRAKKAFGAKFAALVKTALLEMNADNAIVLQASCCMLAAIYLGFHKDDFPHLVPLDRQDVQKIRDKIELLLKAIVTNQYGDGSFPAWKLFRWGRRGYYGGSNSVTTSFVLNVITMVKREILGK